MVKLWIPKCARATFLIHKSLSRSNILSATFIGEIIHESVWWNMHRDITSLRIVGCNDKMALRLISFLKHQIRAFFFHQPSAIRRQNEMYVYGNTSSMGLQNFLTSRAELRPDSRPMFVFRHLRFTAKHKLNFFSAKKQLHVSTRGKFVSVCKPFLGTCLHNTCLTLCM
jgi:hypothetical protein